MVYLQHYVLCSKNGVTRTTTATIATATTAISPSTTSSPEYVQQDTILVN
jgi:hypothetical protein